MSNNGQQAIINFLKQYAAAFLQLIELSYFITLKTILNSFLENKALIFFFRRSAKINIVIALLLSVKMFDKYLIMFLDIASV